MRLADIREVEQEIKETRICLRHAADEEYKEFLQGYLDKLLETLDRLKQTKESK